MSYRCPICGKKVSFPKEGIERKSPFPFCSERCRLVDLNAWLDADYKICTSIQSNYDDANNIPAEPAETDED